MKTWVVTDDGKHNAFTDLIFWRGSFWLVYVSSPSHFEARKAAWCFCVQAMRRTGRKSKSLMETGRISATQSWRWFKVKCFCMPCSTNSLIPNRIKQSLLVVTTV